MKPAEQLSVLMISLDPGLLSDKTTSDVLERHQLYAQKIKSLHIIVIGGTSTEAHSFGNLTIQGTGVKGLKGFWRALKLGKRLIKENSIDLIDCQDPHMTGLIGWLLKRKTGLPLEVHCHGDFIANKHWLSEQKKNHFYGWLQNFILKRVDAVRVVSPLIAAKIKESGLTKAPITVISTPVNTDQFHLTKQKSENSEFIIISNARLVPAKNLFFILQVIKKLVLQQENIRYLIVGEGPEKEALLQEIKRLDMSQIVSLIGLFSPELLAAEYAKADMLLLLSTNESFGKVIIEAGLVGIPTVASRTLGAETIIIPEQTGLLVPINDLEQSVAAIERLISDRELSFRLGQQAAKEYRQRFDRTINIRAIVELWSSLART